ncbi:hypothetical protein HanIR_Chr09g0430301 [Helianthus annuus]|nr:hypothetical protein HanIR_Chr09g0430301 [Helianthus annuus]
MSSTIISSLTTFFSGNGHHSPPHPTISLQPTITLTTSKYHALKTSRKLNLCMPITREHFSGGGCLVCSRRDKRCITHHPASPYIYF